MGDGTWIPLLLAILVATVIEGIIHLRNHLRQVTDRQGKDTRPPWRKGHL